MMRLLLQWTLLLRRFGEALLARPKFWNVLTIAITTSISHDRCQLMLSILPRALLNAQH